MASSLTRQAAASYSAAIRLKPHLCEAHKNLGAALTELVIKHNVQLRRFPAEVLKDLRKLAVETLEEEAAKSAMAGKVNEAFKAFKKQWGGWSDLADRSYFDVIAERYSKLG